MHIAIDTTSLESGHKARGVGQYTKLLIEALQKYEHNYSYSFFTRGQKVPENVDLVHYPYFDPFFLTLPLFKLIPTVVTVHDLIPIAFTDHFPRGLRGEFKWQAQRISLSSAKRIITDSNASKNDIHELVGYPTTRIDVVHLAASPVFQPLSNQALLDRVKKKYDLPERFILYVGDVNWNKNVMGLLKAFAELTRRLLVKKQGTSLKMVLVGTAFISVNLREVLEINRLIKSFKLDGQISRLGFVPEEDLVAIYNLASVYVQPSFAEGFGLPVLEAMASGCPAVVAQGTSLDEIAGPSIRVDPNRPESIAEGIRDIFALSKNDRQKLIAGGYAWVKQFSWQSVAKETVASYEKALERI